MNYEQNHVPEGYVCVTRYFFDTFDDDAFVEDDIGLECQDLETVKREASASLAELARDVLPGSDRRYLKVKVRDDERPVLEVHLTFEAIVLI